MRVPTLVLCGAGDAVTPPADHEAIAARIAGARLVVVPDSGHLSTIEQPEAVTAALATWLAETAYSIALTMSSTTFLASPKTIIVLSM